MTERALPVRPHLDEGWQRIALWTRRLAWVSLAWMTVEGAVGLSAGFRAGSIALVGWALSSVVEGLASIIVIWRFTGARTLSETAEGSAQKGIAISYWLLAPYVGVESVRDLVTRHQPESTLVGIVLTASSLFLMPALGIVKKRLGGRLGSGATAGEGGQNLLCAYLAAAVLVGLIGNRLWGWWWLDPIAGLAVAAVAIKEGVGAWRGESCCVAADPLAEQDCGCGPGCTDPCCADR
jgi:divalent metal cation (Fe/Co/Zn/Cd) transporter